MKKLLYLPIILSVLLTSCAKEQVSRQIITQEEKPPNRVEEIPKQEPEELRTTGSVKVTTDKIEYRTDEEVHIKVMNNLTSPIYYGGCGSYSHAYITLEKIENRKWRQYIDPNTYFGCTALVEQPPGALGVGETLAFIWTPSPPGTYRIKFEYLDTQNSTDWHAIYSSEFNKH